MVTNRALDLAITAFAPGARVVKEGMVHTAAGFAAYDVNGQRVVPRDPLGREIPICRCGDCGTVLIAQPDAAPPMCDVCGTATDRIPLHQPLGFRTDYAPRDFEDVDEAPTSAGSPQLAVNPERGHPYTVGGMTIRRLEQAEVVRVNDNHGRLFRVIDVSGTVVGVDEWLYEEGMRAWIDDGNERDPVAIGDVRPTDVLVLELDRLALSDGVIPTSRAVLPAGLSALWSFAEIVRRGCQVSLDIPPDELQVGLQPARVHDVRTHRVFVADALENGAGYAPELGREENLRRLLDDILTDVAARYDRESHLVCSESCPDCLRSYDNRRLHGALDWRLALDVAQLATGAALDPSRWLGRAERSADAFVRAYGSAVACEVHPLTDGMLGIVGADRQRGVVIGHPLWRHEATHHNEVQRRACLAMQSELGVPEPATSDVWVLQRIPSQVFQLLLIDGP